MVKFAKQLDEERVSEWRSVYVDYRALKKLLRSLAAALETEAQSSAGGNTSRRSPGRTSPRSGAGRLLDAFASRQSGVDTPSAPPSYTASHPFQRDSGARDSDGGGGSPAFGRPSLDFAAHSFRPGAFFTAPPTAAPSLRSVALRPSRACPLVVNWSAGTRATRTPVGCVLQVSGTGARRRIAAHLPSARTQAASVLSL